MKMKKHGASHGAAVIVCTIASTLMVDILRKHVPIVHKKMSKFADFLLDIFPIPFAPDQLNILIYATILATIWGIGFALLHEDRVI